MFRPTFYGFLAVFFLSVSFQTETSAKTYWEIVGEAKLFCTDCDSSPSKINKRTRMENKHVPLRTQKRGPSLASASGRVVGRKGVNIRRLNPRLMKILKRVSRRYGREVLVSSGCRSRRYNRRVGGARRSWHIQCKAADISVRGVSKWKLRRLVMSWPDVGGIGVYDSNSTIHVDIRRKRVTWYWRNKKRKRRSRLRVRRG